MEYVCFFTRKQHISAVSGIDTASYCFTGEQTVLWHFKMKLLYEQKCTSTSFKSSAVFASYKTLWFCWFELQGRQQGYSLSRFPQQEACPDLHQWGNWTSPPSSGPVFSSLMPCFSSCHVMLLLTQHFHFTALQSCAVQRCPMLTAHSCLNKAISKNNDDGELGDWKDLALSFRSISKQHHTTFLGSI